MINEYTATPTKSFCDEQAILDNAFTLIFAFDEIVALGTFFRYLIYVPCYFC